MSSIIRYDDIIIDNINYSKPEKLGQSYFASMSYTDSLKPIYIQTPKLMCKTNISEVKDKKAPYLEVEVPKGRFDMYDLFLSLDDKNIRTTFEKSEEWFKKELSLEAIDEMYRRTTKPFKKNVNPTLKFRVPVVKNEIKCGVYNQKRVFVDVNDVKENMEVILVLHVRGLKILKSLFYCDCYISQIKLFQEQDSKFNIIPEYCVVDEEENEYDDIFDEEILKSAGDYLDNKEKEERLEKERLEAERLEKERLEKESLEKERLEAERLEKERLEAERLEAERLEKESLEKERLEKERLDKEKERLETEKSEKIKKIQEEIERKKMEMEQLLINN